MRKCEKCGREYEGYLIIMDSNPLSISSFLEREFKEDGSRRWICEECREKEP